MTSPAAFFAVLTITAAGLSLPASAAEPPTFELPNGGIQFNGVPLYSEPGNSDVSVSHDTVSVELYFVDGPCTRYNYDFVLRDGVLLIRRVTMPPDTCDSASEQLYGFKGTLRNVPKGKHILELETVIGDKKEPIFRELVKVK